ncbi:MAG: hypothetical protein ABFS86_07345 [Planctomycetota bacterium]
MISTQASAPVRIDLAGGTLDIWPVYLLFPGALTVNLAIRLPARARVTPRKDGRVVLRAKDLPALVEADDLDSIPDDSALPLHAAIARCVRPSGGFTLATRARVPRGSGLGGSSALAVAALRALSVANGAPWGKAKIVAIAKDLEAAVLGIPTGTQDHLASAWGGLSTVRLDPGGAKRERLRADVDGLCRHLVLAIAGASRLSATTNWDMVKGAVDDRGDVRARFREIVAAAHDVRGAILAGDIPGVGRAVEREYGARRGLAKGVETKEMRELRGAAREAGALGGKVCGAGGGGGMLFVVPRGRKKAVSAALAEAGARVLPFSPDAEGLVG